MGQQLPPPGRGCMPWLSKICWETELRALLDCLSCQGWDPELNCFFSSQG